MSDYISKSKLIEWLGDQISHHGESIALVDKGVVLAYKLLRDKINLSEFDQASVQGEAARLLEENERLTEIIEKQDNVFMRNLQMAKDIEQLVGERDKLEEIVKGSMQWFPKEEQLEGMDHMDIAMLKVIHSRYDSAALIAAIKRLEEGLSE